MNIINSKSNSNKLPLTDSGILSELPYFRCAARHLSFTRAATELHLTQSAISHRIKKLERQLGFELFIR
ncbi:MAG: LysR family transcriptional regulator, partial [Pseudomonadales bacterium]